MHWIFYLILVVILVIFGPLASIWALNTLFPVVNIPYTIGTWAAMLIVGGIFTGSTSSK